MTLRHSVYEDSREPFLDLLFYAGVSFACECITFIHDSQGVNMNGSSLNSVQECNKLAQTKVSRNDLTVYITSTTT